MSMTFAVMDVTYPLAAVSQMVKAGHTVVRTERRETLFDWKERRVHPEALDPEQSGFWAAMTFGSPLQKGSPESSGDGRPEVQETAQRQREKKAQT